MKQCRSLTRAFSFYVGRYQQSGVQSQPTLSYPHSNHHLHLSVMHKEVISMFEPKPRQNYLDLTYGAGGHSRELLKSAEEITIYALDRDPVAYELAVEAASQVPNGQLKPLLGKFSDLPELLSNSDVPNDFFDGILIDCGCSSMQFDTKERGFSISKNGPLDMRMDKGGQPSAAEVLANIEESSLARILKVYGEEKQAKKIARAIVEARYLFSPIKTTHELAQLVENACGFATRSDKLQRPSHIATKTFQALRIFINDELNELEFAMRFAHRALKIGGKVVTLTFHSLEDRIVKNHLQGFELVNLDKHKSYAIPVEPLDLETLTNRYWKPINKHVLTPSSEEIEENPRSRSAKLRAAVKLKSI